MMHRSSRLALAAIVATALLQSEPAARVLRGRPVTIHAELSSVAAVRELGNGQLLLTDAGGPAILVVDPRAGSVGHIGREGEGPNEFRRPGGIYDSGHRDTLYVLDRAQPRVLVIDATGHLTGMRSIEQRGTRTSSNDEDLQRVDAALHSYFTAGRFALRRPDEPPDSMALVRFDVAAQRADTVVKLFRTPPTTIRSDGRTTLSRTPIFSPADGWAVAPDGRVAIVRAAPYRVDWVDPSGRITAGRSIAYTPVPVTEADHLKDDPGATATIGSRSAGTAGGMPTTRVASLPREYAKVKPAFDPRRITLAPDGRVWVGRSMPAGAKQAIYDVFDRAGARVDRVAFPARSHVVGFGPATVFTVQLDEDDLPTVWRYDLAR